MVAKKTNAPITKAKQDPNQLLSTALKELKQTVFDKERQDPRLFFPKGIELISITVKVDKYVDVELKVAGAEGIKALWDSKESGVGPPAIVNLKKQDDLSLTE